LLAIGAAIAVLAGGCGEGDGSADDATDADEISVPWGPSVLGYVDATNKICRENWAHVKRSFAERYDYASRGKRFDEAAQNVFLPSLQLVFDNVSYLGAPVGDKPQIEEMLISLQLAVFKGQEGTVTSLGQLETLFDRFNRRARAYELNACSVVRRNFERDAAASASPADLNSRRRS
jgi:hypothetical protein